jgi:hypothetical protein
VSIPATSPAAEEDDDEEESSASSGGKGGMSKVTGIFGGLGALLLLVAFLIFISGKWVNWIMDPLQKLLERQGIPPVVAIGATAVILLGAVGLVLAFLTKSSVVGAMPNDVDFRDTSPAKHADLDAKKLEEYTAAFEALGFRQVTDYTVVTDTGGGGRGFARLLFHPEKHCFAEVNQAFRSSGDAIPMRCSLLSLLEDGWSVATGDRQPTKEYYLIRRPRAVWRSLPGRDPQALFKGHLEFRDRVASELRVQVEQDGRAQAYFQRESAATRERKQRVGRRNAVMMALELWLFDRYPKSEWLGDYPKAARKKR